MKISFSPPDMSEAEVQMVAEALRSGWITTGPKTKEFERRIASYCGVSKAVCLNSATAGLELVLKALGVGEGDEVITSAYTYTASASVIAHVGAKIVLCDVAKDSYEMDYNQLASLITDKTKVIIPVDIGGKLCDYDKIYQIINSKKDCFKPKSALQSIYNRIVILADCAHSFGAISHGVTAGNIADISSFSFHAVKNLTTAEGGAVVWRDMDGLDNQWFYGQFMLWSLHGQSKDALAKTQIGAWEYDIKLLGHKCNMTDIMAGIGLAQLDRYQSMLDRRKAIIAKYDQAFKQLPVQLIEHYGKDFASSGHLYLVRIDNIDMQTRNEIIIKMAERDIATNVHYKPLPLHSAYQALGFDIKNYPNALAQFVNEITLPLHTCLTDEMIDYVIDNFVDIVKKYIKA